jgi:tetratricopeptide (TPR) repeat protein
LERALDHNSHQLATVKGLGLAYTWTGQTDTAVAMFQRLDSPANMAQELYNWAVWWWHYEQQSPQARYAYEVGQALAPEVPQVEYWVAQADGYRREGDFEGARIWYEFVLGLQPDNAAAQAGLQRLPGQDADEVNQK